MLHLSETHFGHIACGAGNRHTEEELLKDLWVKYGRCSASIHLRWEQNRSPPYVFLREERKKKLFRICSDDAILFMRRDLRFDKGKVPFRDILYDKIIPIRETPQ